VDIRARVVLWHSCLNGTVELEGAFSVAKATKLATSTAFLSGKMFRERDDLNEGTPVTGERRTWWQVAKAISDQRTDIDGKPLPPGHVWSPSAQTVKDIHDRALAKIRKAAPDLALFLESLGTSNRINADRSDAA